MNEDEFIAVAKDCDALYAKGMPISKKIIDSLTKCRTITLGSVGVDSVDVSAATAKGIPVTNCPDTFIEEVADHCLMLLLGCHRDVTGQDQLVRDGRWREGRTPLLAMPRLMGQTLGLVAFGHVARAVAKRIECDLAIIDKRRERAGVSEVMNVIGDVKGRRCIMVDDIVDSGGTLCNAAEALMAEGATGVAAYCTHGVLSGQAVDRIGRSSLEELVLTDSIAATEAESLGLITYAPDDLDWEEEVRIAIEERASLSPDALTGLEASLRFGGAETMETRIFGRLSAWQNWIFIRPNAVGETGALKVFGTGSKARFNWERV